MIIQSNVEYRNIGAKEIIIKCTEIKSHISFSIIMDGNLVDNIILTENSSIVTIEAGGKRYYIGSELGKP